MLNNAGLKMELDPEFGLSVQVQILSCLISL
jgi:hypothetical protein